jgi:hypothetical protein
MICDDENMHNKFTLKILVSLVRVAHACNPSYLGGRDQEDHDSKPTRANSLRPYLKKKKITKGLVEWHKV